MEQIARRLALREASRGTGEKPDRTPIEVSSMPAPLTLRDEMRRFITEQISARASEVGGQETFAEADDFEIEEESDLTSQYTVNELVDPENRPPDLDGEPSPADIAANPPPVDPPKAETREEAPFELKDYTLEELRAAVKVQEDLTPLKH